MFRPLWNFLKGLQLPIHFFPSKSSFEEINFLYIFLKPYSNAFLSWFTHFQKFCAIFT